MSDLSESAQGWCDLHLQGWRWDNDGRDLVLAVLLPNGKARRVRFDWAHNVVIDLRFPETHGGMPLTWDAEIVEETNSTRRVQIDFGSTGEIRLVCSGITWTDVD